MFFVAAALVLTTAGVFAGKAKFLVTGVLYSRDLTAGVYNQVSSGSVPFIGLQTTATGNRVASIIPSSGLTAVSQPLYSYNTTTGVYTILYTTF